ncbi:GNAT family N-acetyltransferase [Embleya hyalina]|uniref:GNAT family N-acetyltransferase n=1 Tax=Embleya hyalina TaxID=516124 RepID=UPI000F81E9CC|nr:GNAT family N-acetyltransferase [Embleya hyalina]
MIIVRAGQDALPRLIQFRRDTAKWLSARGIDQWSNPFPPDHIAASIEAGEVYLFKDGETIAATVTLDHDIDTRLWDENEQSDSALYLHKLSVDRAYAGVDLGGKILDWAGDYAYRHGHDWLRIDAWTTNPRLHRYYLDHGFAHVRTVKSPDVVSGWVAQRRSQPAQTDFAEAIDAHST